MPKVKTIAKNIEGTKNKVERITPDEEKPIEVLYKHQKSQYKNRGKTTPDGEK